MAETKSKKKNFLDRMMDRFQGNDEKGISKHNKKWAINAFNQQINALEGEKLFAEGRIEAAQENLEHAICPESKIQDHSKYLQNIANAKNQLEEAEQQIKTINDSIAFFQSELDSF
jgi:chromosome segregation ATPase